MLHAPFSVRHDAGMTDASTSTAVPAVPVAQGVRAPWTAIPAHLRARIAEIVGGGEVVEAVTQTGGFSPGPAVRVRTAAGRRAFVKAVNAEMNPDTPAMHRHEAEYTARMPAHAPVPKLLGTLDEDGWVVLVFEEIDGRNPGPAWDADDLRRVVAALADLAEALTPPPIEAPPVAERLAGFHGWADLRAQRQTGTDDGSDILDAWILDRLDTLAALEAEAPVLCTGNTLLNMDVRSDNILMSADRVHFVDWPWASVGPAWLDLALFVPSVWMHTGPELAGIATGHPLLTEADPEALTAVVACLAGMLMHRSTQPAPPGLPTLRPFQLAFGGAAVEWLRTLLP